MTRREILIQVLSIKHPDKSHKEIRRMADEMESQRLALKQTVDEPVKNTHRL